MSGDLHGFTPPVRMPDATPIAGARVVLERLDAARHGDALYGAAHGEGADPRLWEYLPYGPFTDDRGDSRATWRRRRRRPIRASTPSSMPGPGWPPASSAAHRAPHGAIEIGHVWFGGALQRTPQATEAIFLLARHAFEVLGYAGWVEV